MVFPHQASQQNSVRISYLPHANSDSYLTISVLPTEFFSRISVINSHFEVPPAGLGGKNNWSIRTHTGSVRFQKLGYCIPLPVLKQPQHRFLGRG